MSTNAQISIKRTRLRTNISFHRLIPSLRFWASYSDELNHVKKKLITKKTYQNHQKQFSIKNISPTSSRDKKGHQNVRKYHGSPKSSTKTTEKKLHFTQLTKHYYHLITHQIGWITKIKDSIWKMSSFENGHRNEYELRIICNSKMNGYD